VTDRFGITGGFRYTYEHKDFDADSRKADGSFDFSYRNHNLGLARWTWRTAAEYQLQESVMAYASVSTGFRSGGLNGNATSLADVTGGGFGPEDTRMYEVGVKSELFDRRLVINAAGYYGDYSNLQQAVTKTDGTVSNVSNNATVYGVELEVRALPIAGLELSATLGTMHSSIENSALLLTFPKFNYTLAGQYSVPLANVGLLSVGGSYAYTASFFSDTNNTPILKTPSHGLANAYVSLRPNDNWKFTLTGYNLTDKIYDIGGFYIAGGRLSAVKYPNLPRRFEFTAQYRF
jgi:iron complex outermembrane receptor protein